MQEIKVKNDEVVNLALQLAERINKKNLPNITLIGILRNGLFPTHILSYHLGQIPWITTFDPYNIKPSAGSSRAHFLKALQIEQEVAVKGRIAILVDLVRSTGRTMELAKKHIGRLGPRGLYTASIYDFLLDSKIRPDFVAKTFEDVSNKELWLKFSWENE